MFLAIGEAIAVQQIGLLPLGQPFQAIVQFPARFLLFHNTLRLHGVGVCNSFDAPQLLLTRQNIIQRNPLIAHTVLVLYLHPLLKGSKGIPHHVHHGVADGRGGIGQKHPPTRSIKLRHSFPQAQPARLFQIVRVKIQTGFCQIHAAKQVVRHLADKGLVVLDQTVQCGGIAFLVFGILGARACFASQTTDAQIMQYGADYLSICTLWCMGLFLQCMLEKLLVATGRSAFAMASQLIGALVNIALDPIFIFGLFGVPRMEAAGAAVATVAGQGSGAAAGLTMNLLCNKDINLTLKGFRPAGSTIKRIYAVGIPSIAMNAIGSVMTFAMNNILIAFSSTAVAVFGVYFKLQSFVFMPIFGINNGMVPIIGYNYGARQPKRITQTIKLAVCFAECIMLCGLILAEVFPHVLLGVFNASPTMLAMGILALRIIAIHFPMAGFNVISSSAFQALGRGTLALLVSVIRQLVVLVPAAWLLSHTGNVNAVWFAFPIAELVAVTLCAVFMRKCHRDILLPMEAGQKTAAAV